MWPALSGFLPVESESGGVFYDIRGRHKKHWRNDKEKENEDCID